VEGVLGAVSANWSRDLYSSQLFGLAELFLDLIEQGVQDYIVDPVNAIYVHGPKRLY